MFAKLFRALLGTILIVAGLLLALIGVAGLFSDKENKNLAYGLIAVGSLIALYGYSRGYKARAQRRSTSWRLDPASEKQKEFARDLGIKFPKGITKGELSDKISEVTGE
ncbi:MAG: hypothetical protein IT427_00325 [Pirellulales bacterium]|nr:hypothetical protein [Pirellulales bacterium]